ncbi:MAG: ABC transporter ATP-binding protein [Phycisphaerae bacterium]
MNLVLEVTGLGKAYTGGGTVVQALVGIELSVRQGEFVAVMGASGSGKSTLLHLLGGLDKPSSGSILIENHELGKMTDRERTLFRRRRLGIIFQAYNLLPTLTALENVSLPAMVDGREAGRTREQADRLLGLVNMRQRAEHRPDALSGGEQQRVAIARALMNDPVVVLADEPTGNLDTRHAQSIWKLLSTLVHRDGRTVVAVTHEATGAAFADRIVVLKDGRHIGEIKPDGEWHASVVAARYTALVS